MDAVKNITVPTLFVAGSKDPTVYPWHTELLFDTAVCRKEFELFKGGFHSEDLYLSKKERFLGVCSAWLESCAEESKCVR